MTLLHEVMQRPLDPGYAAAAARRASNPEAPATERRQRPVTVLLAALAGALLVVAVADLRLALDLSSRDVLVAEVEERTEAVDGLEERIASLQGEIDGIGTDALAGTDDDAIARTQLLARVAGTAPVVGPGVRVVMDDAQPGTALGGSDPRAQQESDQGRVGDRDLQVVVNGLWESGAEAIAINGQRLTVASSIREAGVAVLVNFRPLVPPYDVQAIGHSQQLQVAFADTSAGRYLAWRQQNYGVRASVSGASRLELPGATGVRLRYAKPVDATGSDPPTEQTTGVARPTRTDPSEEAP